MEVTNEQQQNLRTLRDLCLHLPYHCACGGGVEMRLIDADALLNKKFKYMVHGCDDLLITIKASDIENAPTIDAVEVVRCKDCKDFKRHTEVNTDFGSCTRYGMFYITKKLNDFCSYGERKEATE